MINKTPSFVGIAIITMVLFSLMPQSFARGVHPDLMLNRLNFDGLERSYYLHLPSNFESAGKLPIVLILHGGGRDDGDDVAKRLDYNRIADRDNFIAVYPNGVDAQWNDGRRKTFRKGRSDIWADDVGFLSALIDHLIHEYKGNPRRVYLTGLSNGGMMTLRLGCEISSKLAAIAPVIANIPKNIIGKCKPDSPLPLLLMNGTEDPLVPWNGGHVTLLRRKMGEVVSTEETIQFWAKHNRCNASPTIKRLPDRNRWDRSTVKVTTYGNRKSGCEVILYAIEGGGHTLPGSNIPNRPRLLGYKNNDIVGTEVIWGFLRRHSK